MPFVRHRYNSFVLIGDFPDNLRPTTIVGLFDAEDKGSGAFVSGLELGSQPRPLGFQR